MSASRFLELQTEVVSEMVIEKSERTLTFSSRVEESLQDVAQDHTWTETHPHSLDCFRNVVDKMRTLLQTAEKNQYKHTTTMLPKKRLTCLAKQDSEDASTRLRCPGPPFQGRDA
jgi:hypothetical protein